MVRPAAALAAPASVAAPVRQVLLDLPGAGGPHRKPPRANLSAVALHGRSLFLGTDEGTVLDRLTAAEAGDGFAGPAAIPLVERLGLAGIGGDADGDAEIDIEGLDVEGDLLWLVGSHSRTRGKPKDDPLPDLAVLRRNPRRHVLGCLPLLPGPGGTCELAPEGARRLPIGRKRGELAKAVRHDEHLAPFLKLPAKENGFDVEGIAVRGRRVLLGLRGPVLRGHAVVLELELDRAGDGLLALRPLGRGGRPWRKHLLDLGGNGVRDLHRDGADVLVLAGPPVALDGRCAIWRWRDPFALNADSFQPRDDPRLRRLLRIPVGDDADRPEGFAILPGSGGREILLVHDTPAPERCRGEGGVLADVFALPG